MTLDDLKEALSGLGDKAEEKAKELYEKIQRKKTELDTETRREVRKAWAFISVVTFLVGVGVGHLFF